MKMPSTYISLLLLCGFMYVFYLAHQQLRQPANPPHTRPVVKEMKPVVKIFSPAFPSTVPLVKSYDKHGKEFRQARLTIDDFSFFEDVVCHIVPALKNVE